MRFSFQSGQLGHSTNTIILKSNEHKSYLWVFGVICTFQSSQFFERLSMHFGVVDHIRASALTTGTADRRPPSWNRITDSTHAPPVRNGIGEPHSANFYIGKIRSPIIRPKKKKHKGLLFRSYIQTRYICFHPQDILKYSFDHITKNMRCHDISSSVLHFAKINNV